MELKKTQTQLLSQLCNQVTYLGRAESWAELSVIETNTKPCNATPLLSDATPEAKQIKVLAPLTPEGLEGFTAAIATLPTNRGKAKWKAPTDVLEALELDIASLHGQGWNGIPGTRWVTYEIKASERFSQQQGISIYGDSKPPTFAKFALVSSVLPNLTQALSVGERFHQALMKWSQDESGKADPVFSGRKDDGQPACDHQHAWYLPEVNKDGKIDHVVVYARTGFKSQQAIKALQRLSKVWGSEGFDLQTVLVSLGYQEGRSLVVGRGRIWRSLTPMVLPRHPKRNRRGEPKIDPKTGFQIDGPEQQTLRLLKQQLALQDIKLPVDSGVEVRYCDRNGQGWLGWKGLDGKMHIKVRCLSDREAGEFNRFSSQAFQRRRYQGAGHKGADKGYWLEIQFEEPQHGPIALGYAAHFGLGVFIPIA